MELMRLKQQMGIETPKLSVKEPVLIEYDNKGDTVDAQEVKELKD